MEDILIKRWGSDIVTGDRKAEKPNMIAFRNEIQALEMIRKHTLLNSRIAVHCDVDLDGVGCGYVAKTFLKSQGATNTLFIINKEKEHGIKDIHADYFNDVNKCDLIIILDSSTNELEVIKKFNCDVLVIDHHEVMHDSLCGKTGDNIHEYVIVNNMLDNTNAEEVNEWLLDTNNHTEEKMCNYIADSRMSANLVLYEVLRVYCEAYQCGNVLENLMLYQWVAVTLFSDVVQLSNDRNQWYIENTVHTMNVESCLQIIMVNLNKYKCKLDKSFISYTFAPTINKAIRAGFSGDALDIVLNRPADICELSIHKEKQANALESAIKQ